MLKKGEVKQNLWKILEAKGKFSLLKHIGQNRWERQEEYSLIIVDNGILKEWVKKFLQKESKCDSEGVKRGFLSLERVSCDDAKEFSWRRIP